MSISRMAGKGCAGKQTEKTRGITEKQRKNRRIQAALPAWKTRKLNGSPGGVCAGLGAAVQAVAGKENGKRTAAFPLHMCKVRSARREEVSDASGEGAGESVGEVPAGGAGEEVGGDAGEEEAGEPTDGEGQ